MPKSPFAAIGLLLLLGLTARPLFANNAGGFVSTVTTPVTTGTETYRSTTHRYLDNGILHVVIANNGNVDSIKYLKPGLPGSPKANGTEMISQTGASTVEFGNHTSIYYYFYPDGNSDAVYLNTTGTAGRMDLACKRTYNPAKHAVPVDMEIHYVLGRGETTLYVYLVANHPAAYSVYPDMQLGFIQMIWPVAHDATDFTCENMYIDDVKTGLSLNGVQLRRQALDTSFGDSQHVIPVEGFPAEIAQLTTGPFAGQLSGKYSYNVDYFKLGTWGRASDLRAVGQWVVLGSPEYISMGPAVRDYVNGWGLMYFMPVGGHYGDTPITVSKTANWTKIFGPWGLYFNSVSTGAASWADAKNQADAEKAAWPYSWLTHASYQPKAQRATFTGKLVINDALRPGSTAAGAWVGLAAPDSGAENATDNWQFQSDNYQYWVQADADGNFTIPNVQTFSPYGGAITYQLYAYNLGSSANPGQGSVGEFSSGPVNVTSGGTTNLGTLTWNVPHAGSTLVWEIGTPDRTAAEFRHGDEYAKPGLWTQFSGEFANPLDYDVATGNWATALNYCHSVDNMPTSPWKWRVNFHLDHVEKGTYWLNIAYASASSVQIVRVNDDSTAFATFTPDNATPGQSVYLRQGIRAAHYTVAHVAIPWSKLRVGANTITLDHEIHSNHAAAHFMYDYIDLEAPAPVVLPPGRDLVWQGGASANRWDNAVNNWLVSGTTTPAVAFVNGDRPIFSDAGSNSPAVNLTGALAPGRMTFTNASKNYTISGAGMLGGAMAFIKSGAGSLTISPTQISLAGSTTTGGSAAVTVSDTANLVAGMIVTGTGIAGGTTVASIEGSTALTLSRNATAAGTVTLTFGAAHTFNGGSEISAGTVTFTNDVANSNGLGVGPVTLSGGTLQMYDNRKNFDSASWDLNVPGGSTGTLRADSRVELRGSLSGSGTFNFYAPWIRTTIFGNWANFLGRINVTTDADGGDFRVANGNGYPHAAVSLGAKVTAYTTINATASYPIGELSGNATAQLSGINTGGTPGAYTATWQVGAANTDAAFAGTIVNGTSPSLTALTKVGFGNWTLGGAGTYSGVTTVAGGTLTISGSITNASTAEVAATLALAGGSVTMAGIHVAADGLLTGRGTINAALVNDGTVTGGAGDTLVVNGDITNNALMRFTAGSSLQNAGTFTNNGTLDLITGAQSLPANFVNNGVVLDSSVVRVERISTEGGTAAISVQSHVGHNYQLQSSTSLASNSWVNVGPAQAGNDNVLTFTDAGFAGREFYRVTVAP